MIGGDRAWSSEIMFAAW